MRFWNVLISAKELFLSCFVSFRFFRRNIYLRFRLQKSLPLLRAAMVAKETAIDGIRPPPAPSQSPAAVVLAPPAVVQAQIQVNGFRCIYRILNVVCRLMTRTIVLCKKFSAVM